MKIAITDACIFIDLNELNLTAPFFSLDIEVHTSVDVFNELYTIQKQQLKEYATSGRLFLHNISPDDRNIIEATDYPNTLSSSDKTVLFLAEKLNAIILSSDKPIRYNAKIRCIEYHGMLWIFDKLVKNNLVSAKDASDKLRLMFTTNIIYQNNLRLIDEMNKRLNEWEKLL